MSEPVAAEIIEPRCLGHFSTVLVVAFFCRSLTTSVQGVVAKSTPFWLGLLFPPTNFLITSGVPQMHAHSITMKECASVTRFLVVHVFGWVAYGVDCLMCSDLFVWTVSPIRASVLFGILMLRQRLIVGTCSQVSCAVVFFQMAAGSGTCQGRKRNVDRFGVGFAWSCDHVSMCGETFQIPVSGWKRSREESGVSNI